MYNAGFKDREINRMPVEKWETVRAKGLLAETDCDKAEDWVMVCREDANDTKYGRFMYSPSLDKLRSMTIGEFYGTGIVD